jgi:hypothetical protein
MNTRQPEPPPLFNEDRKTRELCANEHLGRRCMLPKGHSGEHECHAVGLYVAWK